jgi:hypothetical protein
MIIFLVSSGLSSPEIRLLWPEKQELGIPISIKTGI